MPLILASASPRRAELLRAAGLSFETSSVDIDETFHAGEAPRAAVARVAEAKALAAAARHPDAIILAADTTVVIDGTALGKPSDPVDAARMLRRLAGRSHEVLTGVCLWTRRRQLVHVETSRVTLARLSDKEVAWYVSTGEPADKAGAYAIQGLASRFVERIEGSYSNVVGLPVSSVCALLGELGCDILDPNRTQ